MTYGSNLLKSVRTVLAATAIAASAVQPLEAYAAKVVKETSLSINEEAIFNGPYLNERFKPCFVYTGMPNKETFSIVIREWHAGWGNSYSRDSFSLFYPKDQKELKLGKSSFTIKSVSPEKLVLEEIVEDGKQ